MMIFSEFILLHNDGDMPNEEMICPSLWAVSDTDGDYYYDNIDKRWTNLRIENEVGSDTTLVTLNTYREKNRNYEPSLMEAIDLKRYIEYRDEGRYRGEELVDGMDQMCVTMINIKTSNLESYSEFLSSVHNFLSFTNGVVINCGRFKTAKLFVEDFRLKNTEQLGTYHV